MGRQKMTEWFPPSIKPVHVGEYIADTNKSSGMRRWWDGSWWSIRYSDSEDEDTKSLFRAIKTAPWMHHMIRWRGLAEKPEGVSDD